MVTLLTQCIKVQTSESPFLISCNQQPFSEKAHSDTSASDNDQMTEYAVFSIYFQVPLELDDMPLIL